jgi:sulfur carrier protein ThiS
MRIRVKFTPPIHSITNQDETSITLDENAKVKDLLEALKTQYGEKIIDLLYSSDMGPHESWTSIIVDGQTLPLTHRSDVKLKDGSVVVLLAAIGGG